MVKARPCAVADCYTIPCEISLNPSRASATKRWTNSGSFRPSGASTPVWQSTPAGLTCNMASLTFVGVSPPARITDLGESWAISRLIRQSCIFPVAPLLPVLGSKVSVMKASTSSETLATKDRSSERLSPCTTRLLMIERPGLRLRSFSNSAKDISP